MLPQRDQALHHPLSALDHKPDFSLQPPDVSAGLVQQALRLVHLVAGCVMRLADGFQIGLDAAQIGQAGLQRGTGAFGVKFHLVLVGQGVGAFQKPLLLLFQGDVGVERVEPRRHFGLFFQFVQVCVKLTQDVAHAGEVLARVVQAVFCLASTFLVFGNARCFFQKQAQFFGLAFNDAADGALADDGVGARPQARAEEHVLHVAATHRLVVDVITAGAIARQHSFNGDLAKLAPLAASTGVGVVKHQLDAGAAGRLAQVGAVEDDVLHRLAAQLAGLGLAQHPAHGVHDVGLAAAVGANHTDQLAWQLERGGLHKRLEPGQLDGIEAHGKTVKLWLTC